MINWEVKVLSFFWLTELKNWEWGKVFKTPNFEQTFAVWQKTVVVSFLCWFTFWIYSILHVFYVYLGWKKNAKRMAIEKGSYAKKCCLNTRKKFLCSEPQCYVQFMPESSIYANMCYVHYKCHTSSEAKKKVKLFLYTSAHSCIFSIINSSMHSNPSLSPWTNQLAASWPLLMMMTSFHLIGIS